MIDARLEDAETLNNEHPQTQVGLINKLVRDKKYFAEHVDINADPYGSCHITVPNYPEGALVSVINLHRELFSTFDELNDNPEDIRKLLLKISRFTKA